jgi:hypothetical protein
MGAFKELKKMVEEHYHITKETKDGLREVSLYKKNRGWCIVDNWGDITGEDKELDWKPNLKEAMEEAKKIVDKKFPQGKWLYGAAFPSLWNKNMEVSADSSHN